MNKKDYNIGANGMIDMVGFAVDMVNDQRDDGTVVCPVLRDKTAHYDTLKGILNELNHKETGL